MIRIQVDPRAIHHNRDHPGEELKPAIVVTEGDHARRVHGVRLLGPSEIVMTRKRVYVETEGVVIVDE